MGCNVFTTSMDFIEVHYVELCCSVYKQDCQHGKAFAELVSAASQNTICMQRCHENKNLLTAYSQYLPLKTFNFFNKKNIFSNVT